MRRTDPLILGGGPAGASAAIVLAKGGAKPLILERSRQTGDALCGGFMSWRTLQSLERIGVPVTALSGHKVSRVRLFAGQGMAEAALPGGAIGVSRHRLDSHLLQSASAAGAGIERGVTIRSLSPNGIVDTEGGQSFDAESVFLATGKHNVRGFARPRSDADPAMGLRIRLPRHASFDRLIGDAIELFLFDGGYAGIVLQEDGSANICLAVRKSRLTAVGGAPLDLITALGRASPQFGERISTLTADIAVDAIAAVPYGWRATDTEIGLFRLGDQAAVIPSLAGEGNGIAIASGRAAALAWLAGGATSAPAFQSAFAARTRSPVGIASRLWHWAERPALASGAVRLLRIAPRLAGIMAQATRIKSDGS